VTDIRTIIFPAETRILAQLRSFISQSALEEGISPDVLHDLELAADEAATNVIDHVACETPCNIYCQCSINAEEHIIICEISWTADELFNPDFFPETEHIQHRLKTHQPGGLGIFLIHSLVDEIEYGYKEGRTIMKLVKKFA
jgi:serine/threonine-protein kinase RsbW